jgi:hypothetical protein
MFHADIISIATCFGYTLYHFYAFSGTNLLTRCHSASSLFSAVFGFRKSIKEIFSELDETKDIVNNITRRSRSPKGSRSRPTRGPRHTRARPRVGPRPPMAWWPPSATDAASSPIYSPRRENPITVDHIPRKVPSRPSSSISDRRSSEALPGTLPEGRSSPEGSTSPCLPPEWCVSSPPLDYGSIAVARWLSLYLVPPCLDLVSCLTWSRSSYCNARCCVCWDPMNIDTMFIQVVYLCALDLACSPLLVDALAK